MKRSHLSTKLSRFSSTLLSKPSTFTSLTRSFNHQSLMALVSTLTVHHLQSPTQAFYFHKISPKPQISPPVSMPRRMELVIKLKQKTIYIMVIRNQAKTCVVLGSIGIPGSYIDVHGSCVGIPGSWAIFSPKMSCILLVGESDENHTASLPSSKNKKSNKKLLKSTLNLNPQ